MPEEALKIDPLRTSSFGLAQHVYQQHSATVPAGTTREMLEAPEFWANNRQRLRVHDEIRVVAEDGSFYAKCLVGYVDGLSAYIRVVEFTELQAVELNEKSKTTSKFEVKVCGSLGWCVVNTATNEKIKTKCSSQSVAYRELEDYLRAQAA